MKLCYIDEWEIICFIAPSLCLWEDKIGESVKVCGVEWLEGESVLEERGEREWGECQVQQR